MVIWRNVTIDNRWIVPYNPWLLMKYDCHIMDVVTSAAVCKYLYKYATKGSDFARARITCHGNEIEAYRSVRYVCSSEAVWRLLGFHEHNRHPAVNVLCVHDENHHEIVAQDGDSPEVRQEAASEDRITELMSYFKRSLECTHLNYLEYIEQYTMGSKPRRRTRHHWLRNQCNRWVHRRAESDRNVSRIHYITPVKGDI